MPEHVEPVVTIDGRAVPLNGEPNILELVRKADIELPTFCYHSDLSVYGACRLCLVDIEGRGITGACSTPPEPGMRIRTSTEQLREIRKIAIELLLANHDQSCPTCAKSNACRLQDLARQLGVGRVRFKSVLRRRAIDDSSLSIVRDPNKCVLCGDCVRMCSEIQSVGVIDFAYRGSNAVVQPAFGRRMADVDCVNCGQCASVCPTGALVPTPQIEPVWSALHDPSKTVIAQVAPAVRVGLGECFGLDPGVITAGQVVSALRRLGFDQVYDTAFAADLTVMEEGHEFLTRLRHGGRIPLFTSCCPGWVKFAEQYYPELLPHLSTCRSPQQMFGSVMRELLPAKLGIDQEDLVIVSIMPCTAKKYEAALPKFRTGGRPDVDYVLTTQELARMIEGAGLRFDRLEAESFDLPFGFTTGAGLLFGSTGGVTEAVLRYVVEAMTGQPLRSPEFQAVRGDAGLREASLDVAGRRVKLAVAHGLANARKICDDVAAGRADYTLVEVMACPGGCIGGAGQPVSRNRSARALRSQGLYKADRMLQLHKSQENVFVSQLYARHFGAPGSALAHRLLHTEHEPRVPA